MHPKSAAARKDIADTLSAIELFADVSAEDVTRLIDAMKPRPAGAGDELPPRR